MSNLEQEKIDRLERQLLKARKISPEELQGIVSAPHFFEEINQRITAEQAGKKSKEVSGRWAIFSVWGWQKGGLAVGCLGVLLALGLSLIFILRQGESTAKLMAPVAPEIQPEIATIESPDPPVSQVTQTENPVGRSKKTLERIAFKNNGSKSRNQVTVIKQTKRKPPETPNEAENVFYPLAFAENLEAAQESGQIIRVKLSRSSLLALGFNPPPDNIADKIKTDLLIGSDGIARGIRFVK